MTISMYIYKKHSTHYTLVTHPINGTTSLYTDKMTAFTGKHTVMFKLILAFLYYNINNLSTIPISYCNRFEMVARG